MPLASLPIWDEESLTCFESSGAHFIPCQNKGIPHLITQEDLNDLVIIEKRFKGKCFEGILADYCSTIKKDFSELLHKRRKR